MKVVKTLMLGLIVMATSVSLLAQSAIRCDVAVSQLQNYVQAVNAFANAEYNQNIPARCTGAGPFGFYVHSGCAQMWLQQLNAWYSQQSMLVNQWYGQISQQCTAYPPSNRRIPSSRPADGPGRLDEKAVTELKIDDEDKTVRIKIPSTPEGYKGAYR